MKYLDLDPKPYEHEPYPSDEEMIAKDLFHSNIGNLYFSNAVIRSLLNTGNTLHKYTKETNLNDYDCNLLIQANTIRDGAADVYEKYYTEMDNCPNPFIIIGAGTDSWDGFDIYMRQDTIDTIHKCFSRILERTASIGVRGYYTKRVLVEQVGLPADRIDVIGCPSLRYFGKHLEKFPRKYKRFGKDLRIAVNYTSYCYHNDEAIYLYQILKKYKNSYVSFTDLIEAEMLLNGTPLPIELRHDLLPTTPNHFIMQQNRAVFSPTQAGELELFKDFDFSIGSRIHQAVISVLAGCPAMLIAHSVRVLEIAQHHHIPYITREELITRQPPLWELYYRACWGMRDFYKHYDEKLLEYTDFLQKNGLDVNPDFLL